MTNEHTSLEKYTSHTLFERVAKGLCVRGELETEQTATYWPQVHLVIAALLPHSAELLNRVPEGSWFSLPRAATRTPTNWLQLTRTVCGNGLYNCLTSTCFPWASQLHRIQPVHGQGYILISSTGCTCFLIDGWVEGQYVTSLTIRPYLPSLLTGLLDNIMCPYRATVDKFLLVCQHSHVRLKQSIGEHCLLVLTSPVVSRYLNGFRDGR